MFLTLSLNLFTNKIKFHTQIPQSCWSSMLHNHSDCLHKARSVLFRLCSYLRAQEEEQTLNLELYNDFVEYHAR